ncbi:MAG: hypothetical protein ACI9WU_003407 [Myxococcota bacterium]|jgi:hypothetical protein
MANLRTVLIRVLALAILGLACGGCLDFGIDQEQFICRAQEECGEGYSCLRGPGCYCVCKEFGSAAETDCEDPTCQVVLTR